MKTTSLPLHSAGFTLVELLLASGIGSLVLALAMTGSTLIQRSFLASHFHSTAQSDQLRLSDFLSRDLRPATSVIITRAGQQVDLEIPSPNAPLLQLNLNIPVLNTLLLQTPPAGRNVRYTLQSKELYREEGSERLCLARNLSEFKATRSGAAVTISSTFTPQYGKAAASISQELTTMRRSILVRFAQN